MLGWWVGVLAIVGTGLALMRLSVAADPKPRPRLARWSVAGAFICFFVAGEMVVCRFLLGGCSGWWPYGVGGAVAFVVLLASLWLDLKQFRCRKAEVEQDQKRQRERAARAKGVAAQLRNFTEELTQLFRQVDCPPLETARQRADDLLVHWKECVLEYLDANVGPEAVAQFHSLGTRLKPTGPDKHVESSYNEHRRFLERLLAEVELGKVYTKPQPTRSGGVLPLVESFVASPQKLQGHR